MRSCASWCILQEIAFVQLEFGMWLSSHQSMSDARLEPSHALARFVKLSKPNLHNVLNEPLSGHISSDFKAMSQLEPATAMCVGKALSPNFFYVGKIS